MGMEKGNDVSSHVFDCYFGGAIYIEPWFILYFGWLWFRLPIDLEFHIIPLILGGLPSKLVCGVGLPGRSKDGKRGGSFQARLSSWSGNSLQLSMVTRRFVASVYMLRFHEIPNKSMVGILFFDPWFALRFLRAALFYAGLDSAPKLKRFGTPLRPQNIPSCHKGNKWIKYTPEVQHRPLKMGVGRCWKTTFLLGRWYFRGFVKLPGVLFRQSLPTLQVGEGLCYCCFWFWAISTWIA